MDLNNFGPILTLFGAALAAALPGIGSARGVGGAGEAATGVVAEDPEKFGKMILLQALPGTQGIYGLLTFFLIMYRSGLMAGQAIDLRTGFLFFLAALPIAITGYFSAIHQGKVCESGIALVAKRPNEQAKPIVFAAMVETYAILGLLSSILIMLFI